MNPKKAINLAIDALKEKMRKFAFDANLFKAGQKTFHTERSFKTYKECEDAIEILREIKLT